MFFFFSADALPSRRLWSTEDLLAVYGGGDGVLEAPRARVSGPATQLPVALEVSRAREPLGRAGGAVMRGPAAAGARPRARLATMAASELDPGPGFRFQASM